VGLPAAQIIFDDTTYAGFDATPGAGEAASIDASVDNSTGDVTISWIQPAGMGDDLNDAYNVYYSNSRTGFFGDFGSDYWLVGGSSMTAPATPTASLVHSSAASSAGEVYYLVEPVDEIDGRGSTSYSIGVWTAEYDMGYDTMALPVIEDVTRPVSWYAGNLDNATGLNFVNNTADRWSWHRENMPSGAFDMDVQNTSGYQISTIDVTRYSFIGF
jgi:hypothetical protein